LAPADIRPARREDATAIAHLNEELGRNDDEATVRASLDRLGLRDDELVLVSEAASGEIVGWVHGADRETLGSGRRCEILGLIVDRAARGGGVGRRLVAAVEEWGRSRGLAEVLVRSNTLRQESHPFYEKLGYERSKTQHVYRKRPPGSGAIPQGFAADRVGR
jgi:predicted N-acetyltransferase YhbS